MRMQRGPAGVPAIKIAVIGHIRHHIAPPFMGGMESHCHSLVKALRQAGHDVTLFAAGDSDLPNFISICDQPYEKVLPWAEWRGTDKLSQYQERAFARAWLAVLGGGFDVIYNNSLFPKLIEWAQRDGIPMLTSLHVPPYAEMRDSVHDAAEACAQQFSVTSRSQLSSWRSPVGAVQANMRVVHNGIDLAEWKPAFRPGDNMLWYGRITPTKGLAEAVEAASLAGALLDIVGIIEDETYFASQVTPYLSPSISYKGHLTGAALKNAVCKAKAVIVTPIWDEPFGLVAAEAMSCDVPVIAFDRGALREVLGECGTLVPAGDVEALAGAMRAHDNASHSGSRARALGCFSLEAMVDGYEGAYAAAIAGAALSAASASNASSTVALPA